MSIGRMDANDGGVLVVLNGNKTSLPHISVSRVPGGLGGPQ